MLSHHEGHSDGDSLVFMRRSDVIVTGDVFTPGRYPAIDVARGGSVQGLVPSTERDSGVGRAKRLPRAAQRSFPATGVSARKPTLPSSGTWS